MTKISPLENILIRGFYGAYEGIKEDKLTKIKEIKDLEIFQITKYKKFTSTLKDLSIDGLTLPEEKMKSNCNKNSRILWCGPNHWLLVTNKKDLMKNVNITFNENEFAVTDLSHSRAIIEIEGEYVKEILKKGCPFNFNEFKKNNCVNSVFNGIAITLDMINEKPDKFRLFVLRSFSESFYHSITDSCLEYGYKAL
tara:strand:+ start:8178 stop:8765 length:588 start_codon:yes stop_codon:yes gene_type:complete